MTTEVILPTVAEVLENAADIMEEWGWVQQKFICEQGKMCEEGAVGVSSGWHVHLQAKNGEWTYATLSERFRYIDGEKRVIQNELDYEYWKTRDLFNKSISALHNVGGGVQHNDRPGNTFEKSVAKLKEAAEYARSRPRKYGP